MIGADFLDYTVDRNCHKRGRFPRGKDMRAFARVQLEEKRLDEVMILPWNLKAGVMARMDYARPRGAPFVAPIPEVQAL